MLGPDEPRARRSVDVAHDEYRQRRQIAQDTQRLNWLQKLTEALPRHPNQSTDLIVRQRLTLGSGEREERPDLCGAFALGH